MRQVLRELPSADVEVTIVWIPMVEKDSEAAAKKSSAIFAGDPRVRQFWDGERVAGAAFAKRHYPLEEGQAQGFAWDVYFFYDVKAKWTDPVPAPVDWLKQFDAEMTNGKLLSDLTRGNHDGTHFQRELAVELLDAMKKLTAE